MDKIEREIIKKGLTAPRVKSNRVEEQILHSGWTLEPIKEDRSILVCVLTMKNGFVVASSPILIKKGKPIGDMEDNGIIEHITSSGSVLRWAYQVTIDGCYIGLPSASVSPENDNKELSEKIARKNLERSKACGLIYHGSTLNDNDSLETTYQDAFSMAWGFEGYLLATELKKGK
jgi:hypothetical protein